MENDISKMSLDELKVLAYDNIAQLEQVQNNLKLINQQINKLNLEAEKVKK